MFSFKEYTIADWFSFYRMVAAPVLIWVLFYSTKEVFTWLLLISYLTDKIDGTLARQMGNMSERGASLDSVGDQITFLVALAGLYVYITDFIHDHMYWILGLFGLYILQMILAYIKYGKPTAFHTYSAKASAVAQAVFILVALFFWPVHWLFWVVIVLGAIETIEEISMIFLIEEWKSDVRGIYWMRQDLRK